MSSSQIPWEWAGGDREHVALGLNVVVTSREGREAAGPPCSQGIRCHLALTRKEGGKNPLVVLGKVFFSLVFNIPPGFIFKSNNPASVPWQLGWCPACLSPVPAGKGQSSCCRQGLREEGCLPVSSARSLSRSICETWKGLIIRPRSCPNCDFH